VDRYDPTIEDSYRKQIEIDGTACVLDIMDTAGQEEYKGLRETYMKSGEGFLIVYSLIVRESLETAEKFRNLVIATKGHEKFPIVLVGNKKDLAEQRVITEEEGRSLAQRLGTDWLETSAKTGENIKEAYFRLVRLIDRYRDEHPDEERKRRQKLKKSCIIL